MAAVMKFFLFFFCLFVCGICSTVFLGTFSTMFHALLQSLDSVKLFANHHSTYHVKSHWESSIFSLCSLFMISKHVCQTRSGQQQNTKRNSPLSASALLFITTFFFLFNQFTLNMIKSWLLSIHSMLLLWKIQVVYKRCYFLWYSP